MAQTAIVFPRSRIVRGDLYKPQDKDAEGNPLVAKNGPNKGQPRVDFFFAIAIPKGPEQGWWQTAWGQIIMQVGAAAFPQAYQAAAFSWKVTDGDSAIPNKKGKKPCDNLGYPGHWVINLSSGFAPKVYTDGGERALPELNAVKPGYWVEVAGTVDGNGSTSQPGVYLNHSMVNFLQADTVIPMGPDATAVGFSKGGGMPPGVVPGAAPAAFGAAPVPLGMPGPAAAPLAPMAAAAMPMAMGMPAAAVPGMAAMPSMPGMAPVAVAPNFGALMPPAGAPVVMAAPVRQMTAKAQGNTYEQLIANGWTDAVLIQHGLMLA